MSLTQGFAAIVMVGVAFAFFITFRRYMANASERRMQAMLQSVGLEPAAIASNDTDVVMKEILQRCRHCASEDVCERWLAGEAEGTNAFCPNAAVFEALATRQDGLFSTGASVTPEGKGMIEPDPGGN